MSKLPMPRHLFGPIPSRRLGVSLGIDLTPGKDCTFNCLYCECGATEALTATRREYVPTAEVITELRGYLSTAPQLDSITFSGSGEPTLHSGIGEIIAMLKREFPSYRVTVITNSSLLWMAEVRAALRAADLVIPSLDAVSESVFRKMNRPQRDQSSARLIEGLRDFCRDYAGLLWIELFIIEGINDGPEELALFRSTLATIRHDRIQLNTLDRPGAVSWIVPVPTERLDQMAAFLGPGVEVIASRRTLRHTRRNNQEARDLLLATVQVRPSTREDLLLVTGLVEDDLDALLRVLVEDGFVVTRTVDGVPFFLTREGDRISRHSGRE
jgi:wyosine [tRNA(Phe)-imidazoG37] synthetase (radical SAM superfamily)